MSRFLVTLIFIFGLAVSAFGQTNKGINFQGYLTTPSGNTPSIAGATVNLKVLSPNGCILREEEFTGVNILNGYVNLVVGHGTVTGADPGLALQNIFENTTVRSSLACVNADGSLNVSNTTYTPTGQDARKLRVDTTISGDRILLDFNLRALPFAMNSETLNGKSDSSFINVNGAQNLTQSNVESIFNRYTKLDAILNGFNAGGTTLSANITGNAATATNVTGTVAIANGGTGATSAAAARTNLGIGTIATMSPTGTADATTFLRGDGTWFAVGSGVTSVAGRSGVVSLTTADVSDFNTAADARITVQKGANSGLATLDGAGKIPVSQLALTSAEIPNLDYSKITTGKPTTIDGYGITDGVKNLGSGAGSVITGVLSGNTAGRPAFGSDGRLYIDTQAGIIYRDSGTAWVTVANVNSAIGTVNSLTGDVTASGSGAVAATVVKIQGHDIDATAPTDGKVLKYIGSSTNKWTPSDIKFADIKNAAGNTAFVGMGACTTSQTVKWSALTDTFECQPIAGLDAAVLSTGNIPSARLPAASASADGIVNQIAQSFSGVKTFVNNVIMQGTLSVTGLLTASGGVAATGTVSSTGDVTATGTIAATGAMSADRIKLANSSATCDASVEGSLRYNSTSKKMEFCNGSTWGVMTAGTIASLSIGSPSASLVKAGPVDFVVTYGSGVDTATINLISGNITLGGTGATGCAISGVAGTGLTRTVTVNGCTGTGTVNITVASGSANSTTGDAAPAAGPSTNYTTDNTGPNAPTGVVLGSVPSNLTNSPTITYSAASDVGGSTVANHQVQIVKTSDSSVIRAWTNHTSGSDVGSLTLLTNTSYTVYARAVDALGNTGTPTAGNAWTSINDPCLGSPSPGTVCTGGSIFLGSLSPGATSGSGTDKYMTTPGGCSDIPAGSISGGSGSSAYANADFTPASCSGTDVTTKFWNDGTGNWYDIPGLTNFTSDGGPGYGTTNTDQYYGSFNTTTVVAITSTGQGGYHAAARYCDKLSYGGYTDWHLPNRKELNLMWSSVGSIPGLEISGNFYWASTESGSTGAWMQRFLDGYQATPTQTNLYKYNSLLVRCVRRY